MVSLCQVCGVNEFKYRCPRCLKVSCSLQCSKKHKIDDTCNGVNDFSTEYLSSETLKTADDEKHEDNHLVQRDFNFLTRLKRELDVSKASCRSHNKRILQIPYKSGAVNKMGRRDGARESSRVWRRGVDCVLLPKGMQRSLQNKSKWDKPLDLFVWSIEWVLFSQKNVDLEPYSYISHRVKETDSLAESMGKSIFDKCVELYTSVSAPIQQISNEHKSSISVAESKKDRTDTLLKSNLKFYLKSYSKALEPIAESKILEELSPMSSSMAELLKDKTVIEFPTIYIAEDLADIPSNFTIKVPEQLNNIPESIETAAPVKIADPTPEEDSDSDSDNYNPGVSLDFL